MDDRAPGLAQVFDVGGDVGVGRVLAGVRTIKGDSTEILMSYAEQFCLECLAAEQIVRARMQAFGCEGQASKIKAMPLEKMAERYKAGELSQIVK